MHARSGHAARVSRTNPDHYSTLGLGRNCTTDQIRNAYRLLAKQLHPDVNRDSPIDAVARMQALNAAYEILADDERRRAYDAGLKDVCRGASRRSSARPLTQDVYLRISEFLRGTKLEVRVNDPGNSDGPELYSLEVPPETVPGTRFKLVRNDGSTVIVRVRARPDLRFKVRGSDLRCDLRISAQRAIQGGTEFVQGPTGTRLRVTIPPRIARGDVVRVSGEGLPRPRGGRGDLLVRIVYRPEVRITRSTRP
jgi:DnaJ-class molecular chaperone